MTQVKLNAQLRTETGSQAKRVRTSGFIPAVVYGFKTENKNIKVNKHDFTKAFAAAGEFNLVDLTIDGGQPAKVIIKDLRRDGLTGAITHVDFYQVDMTKKITTEIPLNFLGEAKAVKELGGTLVKNMDAVEIKCLPGDLVSHIDVDISQLAAFDQFIRLRDLKLPAGIELAHETNEAVVGVAETKAEVEEAPKPVEGVPAEGETGAVPAEGEKAAGEAKPKEAKK